MSFFILLIFFAFSCATSQEYQNNDNIAKELNIVESYNAGLLALSLQDYKRAISLLNKCLKNNYNPDFTNLYIGIAYLKIKQFEKAEHHLKRALELNPELTEAHNSLGAVYAQQKKYNLALKEFFKVLEDRSYLFPENALYNIALIYYNTGDYLKSIDYCNKTLVIVPKSPMVYYLIALNYFKLGKKELTKRYLNEIIKNFKNSTWRPLAEKFLKENKL